jgi:hypothetical protein
MHMRVSDKYLDFEVVDGGNGYPMVQLYSLPERGEARFSRPFSSAITTGEAGIYPNDGLYPSEAVGYYYPHELRDNNDPLADVVGNTTFETFSPLPMFRFAA